MIGDFFNILILLGALQGIITSVLLFTFKSNKPANTILAGLTLVISLACLNDYFLNAVESTSTFWTIASAIIPLIIFMPVGPLAYFYVKTLLYPEFRLGKSNRPHFYPIIIDLIPYFAATMLLVGGYAGLIGPDSKAEWQQFIDTYFVYSDIPRWLSLCVYLWLTQRLIREYSATNKESPVLKWAKRFTSGLSIFAIIWLLHLVPYLTPALSNRLLSSVGWYPVFMPLIVLIYWVGINGFLISLKNYRPGSKKVALSESIIDQTVVGLEKAMQEEKLYLNPALKLNDLVDYLDVPQKTVSAVLNQHLKKSFNEFVNDYRIEACKLQLTDKSAQHLTISGIAYECGFNSQATFQRAFKASTGISPKEYLQKHEKSE